MNRKAKLSLVLGFVGLSIVGSIGYHLKTQSQLTQPNVNDVLLSLIKNDLDGFKSYIVNGGSIYVDLPAIDGKQMSVAEGLAYFDRTTFVEFLKSLNVSFIKQNAQQDFLTIAFEKKNPKMLDLILSENIDFGFRYGDKSLNLLHLASLQCSDQFVKKLALSKKIDWKEETLDGHTALSLAAEHECLSTLGFWKEQGADFKTKSKKGISPLEIIKKKSGAAIEAFGQSFETRQPASTVTVAGIDHKRISFYKKREVPKDVPVDYSAIVEPKSRPDEANETAAHSEFSD